VAGRTKPDRFIAPSSRIVVNSCLHSGDDRAARVAYHSPTARLWDRLKKETTLDCEENKVDAEIWFDRPFRPRLWEESMPLGYTGLVLTFLSAEDPDDDD
jgi:hypothetical protein